jgi:hypothetical protein
VFSTDDQILPRRAFRGTVWRGHLERGGKPISELRDVDIEITRVVYARELRPDDRKSDQLEYLLFGKGPELFLAHRLMQAPDFDQVLAVKIIAHNFSEAELGRGVTVLIRDRENSAAQRLQAMEIVAAQAHVTGAHQVLPLQIHVGIEYYFEEGELSSPPDSNRTPLEKIAGF